MYIFSRSLAEPGNAYSEALPHVEIAIVIVKSGGGASRKAFSGKALGTSVECKSYDTQFNHSRTLF
jgi:hypothetical protein